MNNQIKVAISFSETDSDLAGKIINGLIEHNIKVISDSKTVSGTVHNWGKYLFELIEGLYDKDVSYCIVLLTDRYIEEKWSGYNRCKLLQTAFERNNFILPVKVGSLRTYGKSGLNHIDSLDIGEGDFQTVIDTFIEKATISSHHLTEFKGYKDIRTILKLHYKGQNIDMLSGPHDIDKEKKIGFDLFSITEPTLKKITCYVLYLYESVTLKNTHEHLQAAYGYIFRSSNLIIILPHEKHQKDFDARKRNITAMFGTDNVFYLKEFLWEFGTPVEFRKEKHKEELKNFVSPYLKDIEGVNAIEYIRKWLSQKESPVLVLKGTGGIGKTTLAKWLANEVHANLPNTRAVRIDSSEIVSLLKRTLEMSHELDLYRLYETDYDNRKSKNRTSEYKLDNDEFRCNIDNGNIIIIIDGLDEIIIRLGKMFNLSAFMASVHSFSSDIGNGKVLITCRSYFWDQNDSEMNNIESVEILPFDKLLAEKYFNNYYPNSPRLAEKGMKIAAQLTVSGQVEEYIPFVLDVVTFIIDSKFEDEGLADTTFNSEILRHEIHNDYLLYKICAREVKRVDQVLNADGQVNLFIRLTAKYNGAISTDDLTNEIAQLSSNQATEENIKAFHAHPILSYSDADKGFTFKYDLFQEHFKNIYVGLLISGKSKLNSSLISILSTNGNYNSGSVEVLSQRFPEIDEDLKFCFLQLIDDIKNYTYDTINLHEENKKKSLCSLLILILKIYHKKYGNTMERNTEILKDFFASGHMVSDFHVIRVNSSNSPRILFDFSNLYFVNCSFSDYEYFADCRFNSKTLFEYCFFEYIPAAGDSELQFKSSNFKASNFDLPFKEALKLRNIENRNTKEDIMHDITLFLSNFFYNGMVWNNKVRDVRRNYKPRAVSYEKMLKYLVSEKMLSEYRNDRGEEKIQVKEEFKNDLIKFMSEEKVSTFINKAFTRILNDYKP